MTEAGPQKLIATTDEKSDLMNMVKSVSAFSGNSIIQFLQVMRMKGRWSLEAFNNTEANCILELISCHTGPGDNNM